MNEPIELPITGLDTLFVPEADDRFWADLHDRLVDVADMADGDGTGSGTGEMSLEVRDIGSAPSATARRHTPRRLLAAAAVLVVVIGGLAVVRLTRSDDQRPADRTDVVIDDPQGIDLDDLRREGLGWEPEPSGPYQVFAFPALSPEEWSTSASGYDIADTRATWDWWWGATLSDVTNQPRAWQLEVVAPETAVLALPDGDPVTVRGTQGVVTDDNGGEITWIERDTRVTLRWIDARAPFDLDAGLAIAAGFEPIEIDRIGIDQLDYEGPFRRTGATPLGGRMSGFEWWIDVSSDPDIGAGEQVSVIVSGQQIDGEQVGGQDLGGQQVAGGGFDVGAPIRITSTMPFGLGRFMAGRVEGDLESVVVQLSDDTLITLPVHDEGDTTLWAVPIPIGLDVVQVQLVAPGGTDVTAITVPVYLDQVGAMVTPG